MSSSERGPRQVPAPPNSRAGLGCSRFIPREELQGFAAWQPAAFNPAAATGLVPTQPPDPQGFRARLQPASAQAVPRADPAATLAAPQAGVPDGMPDGMPDGIARQIAVVRAEGYQAGYNDGLAALERFKAHHASLLSAQIGQLLAAMDQELGALEQQIAASVARVATELARQVVRSELSLRPALVVQVAREAVSAVLASARQITMAVNPEDHALVAAGCEEALAARGARLLSQASVARGGCRIESDAGVIDARIASRWDMASHALGTGLCWDDSESEATGMAGDA